VGRWITILHLLPFFLPAITLAFGIVGVTLLLFDFLHSALAFSLGILLSLGFIYVIFKQGKKFTKASSKLFFFDLGILVFVLAWCLFNAKYTAQHVFTDRDPATYTVAAVRLIDRQNLRIETPEVFDGLPHISSSSFGFVAADNNSREVHAQGLHALPVLLGLGGRIVGVNNMMRLNVLVGGLAILSVYGFSRLIMRPKWAGLAALTLATALPLIYFSRDIYTEPLTLVFTFSGMSLLIMAMKNRSELLWMLSGLMIGATALIRIDSLLTIAAFLLFIFVYLHHNVKQKLALKEVAFFSFGMMLVLLIGWLDLTQLSVPYYKFHKQFIFKEAMLIGLTVLAGSVSVLIKQKAWLKKFYKDLSKLWNVERLTLLILTAALMLASRPLWLTLYYDRQNSFVEGIQAKAGLPVEPRSYAEFSASWIVWYIGVPIAILGTVGLALMASKLRDKKASLIYWLVLLVILVNGIYMLVPSVTPDQVWASRRLLPVILPGLIVCCLWLVDQYDYLIDKLKFKFRFFIIIAASLVLSPLMTTRPFLKTREYARLPAINDICEALPKNAVVLWAAQAQYELVQPTQEFCSKPSAGISLVYPQKISKSDLKLIASKLYEQNKLPVIGVYGEHVDHVAEHYKSGDMASISSYSYNELERTLLSPPRTTFTKSNSIYLGVVKSDGKIVPLSSRN
jgi:hypothetical protein